MNRTEILESAIIYKKSSENMATHFALCKGTKIRYLISLNDGVKRLVRNVSTYSNKLSILMKIISLVPLKILAKCNLGYYVKANFSEEIATFVKKTSYENSNWNVIVGTYDEKQKIVIQLWENSKGNNKYYKIGNNYSDNEMTNEIDFLQNNKLKYKTFNIPNILDSQLIKCGYKFNVQLTEEFVGNKVDTVITYDIYKIYKEIVESKEKVEKGGILYGFSHGDFAPWNIKKDNKDYIVFDWEHCGMRFYGFDLIHYIFSVEFRLNNKSKNDSIFIAVEQSKKIDKILNEMDSSVLSEMYFKEFYGEY